MPLNRTNQRFFHRFLYAGQLESVRLLKRGDDQRQGEITAYTLHECRRSQIHKAGQTLDGDAEVFGRGGAAAIEGVRIEVGDRRQPIL